MDVQRGRRAQLSLSAAHVGELVAELRPLVEGAEVLGVVPLPPRDLLLLLRSGPAAAPDRVHAAGADGDSPSSEGTSDAVPERTGPVLRLRLSAAPDLPRLFLQTARQRRPSGPPGPFFRNTVEELVGARLTRLEQVRGDRLVRLEFEGAPDGGARTLVLELTGRRANLVLLGPGQQVIDVLVPPKAKATETPRIAPGAVWSPPEGAPRVDPGDQGLAASLAEDPEQPAGPPLHPGTSPAADGDARDSGSAQSGVQPGAASGPADERAPAHPRAPLSHLVEHVLGATVAGSSRARLEKDLASRLERKLRRARSLLAGLEEKAAAADGAERTRMDGDLLKVNLQRLKRGMESVELEDLFGEPGATRTLALDPRRSPHENVQRLFDRYHKQVRAQATVHAELGLCGERIEALADLVARLKGEGDHQAADPEEIEREAIERRLLEPRQQGDPRKRKAPEPRLPYRRFRGSRGSEIRVGRTAKDNDALTLHHSRGSDLWLHTADSPGSHVVLRLDKGATPDPEEVLDAAHLAVHFSPQRKSNKAQVHIAARKFVTKPKGAKAGLVNLSGGRTMMVRMQPQRLEGLLAGAARRPPPDLGPTTPR